MVLFISLKNSILGVHQKALETYDIIFKCMGTNRLATELFIYSAGLFPLLCNAALNVRPILLSIYETHFVPLGERLRPALNGFLSGNTVTDVGLLEKNKIE